MQATVNPKTRKTQLYNIFFAAALNDEPCPTNLRIAAMMGLDSKGNVSKIISLLEADGLIEVRRSHASRVVYLPALQKSISTDLSGRGRPPGTWRYDIREVSPAGLPPDTPPLSATLEEMKAVKHDRDALEDFEEALEKAAKEMRRPARLLFANWHAQMLA